MGHDLNATLLFVRVVECGSFRAAAKLTGVPKSSLSRKMAELEQRLGARLLQRTTRRIGLTEVGRQYFAQVSPAIRQLAEAESAVADLMGEPRGSLRIATSNSIGAFLLPPVLLAYQQKHPSVRVVLDLSERLVDLVQEGFDLAIRAGPMADSSLVARRLGTIELNICASPGYLALRGTPSAPGDLASHDCLSFAAWGDRWDFMVDRQPLIQSFVPRLSTNSHALLCEAAVAGLGLARLPSFVTRSAVASGLLVPVLASFAPPPVPLHAVHPSARHVTPAVRLFLDQLKQSLGAPGRVDS